MERFDVAVIGGGIAGVSAACHAAPDHSIVLLEQERELAYHTTSRSAAIFAEDEGGTVFSGLSRASRSFLEAEHDELDAPLLDPLPFLKVGPPEARDDFLAASAEASATVDFVEGDALRGLCPVLRPDVTTVGLYEPGAASIDVMGLHQLYLRRARAAGTEVRRSARVTAIERRSGHWHLSTAAGPFEATVIVNAAGAWGDVVARLAGAQPVGLTPLRRTAFTTKIDVDPSDWPFVFSTTAHLPCYFKPEAGNQLLASLADETPSQPCDARPEEIDVAMAIEHINSMTTLNVRSVGTTWAGLRTFAPDRQPVFGWDDRVDDFFWLVGQGGYGILSSRGAGLVAAALLKREPLPLAIAELGLTEAMLAPRRNARS